jgi:SAM-dependent methyltransferase
VGYRDRLSTDPAGTSYTDRQYEENYPDGVEHSYWNLARNRVIEGTLDRAARAAVVLDVGCGRGVVVDYLRRRGIDAWGCETGHPRPLNPEVAPYVMTGTDAATLDPGFAARVDTLLFLDVLEHVDDPAAMLVACRARCPNLRRITITVPARAELWTNYDDHYGHRRRYDLAGVRALAACVAPARVDLGYFFHALYPAIRAVALLGRRRAIQVTAPAGRLARAAHRALAAGFTLDARLLPRSLPGSSIVAVLTLRPGTL